MSLESLLQKQSGLHGWVALQEPSKSREHVAAIELEVCSVRRGGGGGGGLLVTYA